VKRADIPADVELRVRSAARHHCGYCLSPQHLVMARLEIEHIIPLARGGNDDESNLWLACPLCNGHKSAKVDAIDPASGGRVSIFNPRTQVWYEHFAWTDDGLRIEGLTPIGRATVVALHLSDDPDAITVRSYWVLAGWHPPTD
jgi:hypothetical protein